MNLRSRLVILFALIAFGIPAHAQLSSGGSNVISVNGEAEVRVVPDEVILTLGVETFDKVLKVSKKLNDDRIIKTIGAAKSHGIAAEHIQTDYIGIEPRYQNYEVYNPLLGYVVRKTVVIRLKDLSKFEELLTDALEAGVTHVHGVEFRTTELRKYRDEARKLALKAAREKAELLAGEAGRTVGKAVSIGESAFGYSSSYGSWWGRSGIATQNVAQIMGGASVASDSTLAPGQIAVRATVNTSFTLD